MVIIIILASLLLLTLVAMLLGVLQNRMIRNKINKGELDELPDIQQIEDMECCGQHEMCEKESLLAAVSKQIEYYDDEELDAFRGIQSDSYTLEQIEQFRDVLYTMKDTDVAGWVRSLMLRSVELPDEMKDEVFLIVGERRMNPVL